MVFRMTRVTPRREKKVRGRVGPRAKGESSECPGMKQISITGDTLIVRTRGYHDRKRTLGEKKIPRKPHQDEVHTRSPKYRTKTTRAAERRA